MNEVYDTTGRLNKIETVQGGPGTGLLQRRPCGQGPRSLKPSAVKTSGLQLTKRVGESGAGWFLGADLYL